MAKIEFIATLRCMECGDIISLAIVDFDEATKAIRDFKEEHKHGNPGPWVV
jgi:hypothetical protein